jgi:hypothetical protein
MGKSLLAIDFDDTLVRTAATVKVTHDDGSTEELTPAQYAQYDARPNDAFDYSQFDDLVDPRPIKRYNRILHKAVDNPKIGKVVVLTARSAIPPVAKFLSQIGITKGVKIVPLNSGDPNLKRAYIERQIENGFDRLLFVDDSHKNINAVAALRQKYPNVRLMTHQPTEHDIKKPTEKKRPPYRISKLGSIINTRIRNPQTGNDILIKTALGYEPSHPMRKIATQYIKRNMAQ